MSFERIRIEYCSCAACIAHCFTYRNENDGRAGPPGIDAASTRLSRDAACADIRLRRCSLGSEALRHGVKGYLTTSTPLEVTVAAIRLLLAGGVYCAQPVGERHDRTASAKQPEKSESSRAGSNARGHSPNGMEPDQPAKCSAAFAELSSWGITAREAEVLSELQRGCSNKLIARALNLSENTVKMHLRHIMCKLHVRNRTEAVLLSQKHLYEKTERNSQKRADRPP